MADIGSLSFTAEMPAGQWWLARNLPSVAPVQPNLLGAIGRGDITAEPFDHVLRHRVLPEACYAALQDSFPALETIMAGRKVDAGNAAVRLSAIEILRSPRIASAWRDFFAFHTSADFWAEIVRVFGPLIRNTYPQIEQRFGRPLEDLRVGVRGSGEAADVRLDCQFVMNTPGTERGSVKTPHVDKRQTLFSSLFYLRDAADETEGGDLDLYAWKRQPRFLTYRMILPEDIEHRRRIGYAANTMICFVNTPQAVHGVSARAPSTVPRRYINLVAELPFHLFSANYLGLPARLWYWKQAGQVRRRQVGSDY
ncbi:MAG TPA: hypothetical protein VM639_13125 [Dongiaceae bacterium]|nr:hypothetical protein [Dongiaceae bacterium]